MNLLELVGRTGANFFYRLTMSAEREREIYLDAERSLKTPQPPRRRRASSETKARDQLPEPQATLYHFWEIKGEGEIPAGVLKSVQTRARDIMHIQAQVEYVTGKSAQVEFDPSLSGLTYQALNRGVKNCITLFENNPEAKSYMELINMLNTAIARKLKS